MAVYYESQESSIAKELKLIYGKYDWYKEVIKSVTMSGKEGSEKIANIMTKLIENIPKKISDLNVIVLKNFQL